MIQSPVKVIEAIRNKQIHLEKLIKIREQSRSPSVNSFSNKQYHSQAFRHKRIQKLEDIDAQNEVLLKRIININNRKRSISMPSFLPQVKMALLSNKAREHRMSFIQNQNNHIARKLVSCKSHIPPIKSKQHDAYLQIRNRLRKFVPSNDGTYKQKSVIMAERILAKNPQKLNQSVHKSITSRRDNI